MLKTMFLTKKTRQKIQESVGLISQEITSKELLDICTQYIRTIWGNRLQCSLFAGSTGILALWAITSAVSSALEFSGYILLALVFWGMATYERTKVLVVNKETLRMIVAEKRSVFTQKDWDTLTEKIRRNSLTKKVLIREKDDQENSFW